MDDKALSIRKDLELIPVQQDRQFRRGYVCILKLNALQILKVGFINKNDAWSLENQILVSRDPEQTPL
jgi:hypothetical protein